MGLIGGSLGLAFKRCGFKGRIVGVSKPETVRLDLDSGVIDEGWPYEDLKEAVNNADLIFVCTPIGRILELIEELGPIIGSGTIVTDVGSTKRNIVNCAKKFFPEGTYFVGGHPMAGSERSGVTAADPFLFQNAIYILTPDGLVPAEIYGEFVRLLRSIGARVLELDEEAHDKAVAAISHLPQLMATKLVEVVGRLNEQADHFLPLAAGGFRDMTRIASSEYDPVWRDIYGTNSDYVSNMIDLYIAALKDARDRLSDGSLKNDFSYANNIRSSIPKDAKGFLYTLHEIRVVAEDRPGVLAEIALTLKKNNININDIEVLKVREGEGGTLRLGFDSEESADHAVVLLTEMGYRVRRP